MALKTSLLITGDSTGAVDAIDAANRSLDQSEAATAAATRAYQQADQAIGQLANAQAQASREIDASKAAFIAGEITLEQYNRELLETKSALSLVSAQHRAAMTNLRQHTAANDDAVVSIGQQRAGMQQLSYQIGDVAQQFALGVNPMVIFAQQGGQVVQALSLMKGGASGLLGFLGGPWGAVIMGAATVVGMFGASLLDSGDDANSAAKDYLNAAAAARELVGAMNAVALAKRQISLNEKRDRAMELELVIGSRPTDANGRPMFSYTQQKELDQLRWEIAQESSIIDLAEQENVKQQRRLEELEAKRNKKKKERAARTPRGESAAARAERGEDMAFRIANIRDQFSDLPAAVERSNKAMRQLDDIASDVERRRPPNYAQLKTDLADARKAVEDSLIRPFSDYLEQAREAAEIDQLLIAGKDDQAEALKIILSLERQMKPLSEDQRAAVLATVQAERDRALVLRDQRALIQANVDAVHDMRAALEQTVAGMFRGRFSIKSIISSIGNSYINTASQRIVESMFGDVLRSLEKQALNQESPFEVAMTKGGDAVTDFATTVRQAIARINGQPVAGPSSDVGGETFPGDDGPSIGVTGNRRGTGGESPADLIVNMADGFFRKMGIGLPTVVTDGIKGALAKIEEVIPNAFAGALTGATASQIILGGKGSSTGGALGGALGGAAGKKFLSGALENLLPGLGDFAGPLGSIAGGLLGGVVGGLFKKTKTGAANITSVNGDASLSGNSSQFKAAAGGAADSIQSGLQSIADALGGGLGAFNVTIGQRHGDWRVRTGTGSLKVKKGAKEFDDDQEGAMSYAISLAISQGAVTGLSAAVQKAIKSSTDIDKALQEALKVQDLELLLGGIGAQLDKTFRDFDRQAQERLRIARQYGFDVVKVEEQNAKERLKLTEDLLASQIGSLQDLIAEMTSGSLFEGTVLEQRDALLVEIAKAKAEADAGTEGAADTLASLLEQLNAVSKEAYGTTGGYAADRASILDQARDTIAQANQRIADAQARTSDPALATTNAALDENNDQNAQMLAALGINNALLQQLLAQSSANSLTAAAINGWGAYR